MDTSIEKALLGSIMLNPLHLEKLVGIMLPEHFAGPENRVIFKAMLSLKEKGQATDLPLVTQFLLSNELIEKAGGVQYVSNLSDSVGFEANCSAYAAAVIEAARIREFRNRATEIQALAKQPIEDLGATVLRVESILTDLAKVIPATCPQVKRAAELCETHYTRDEIIGGGILPRGAGLILAGESGEGKSLIRLEMAIHLAMGKSLWAELEVIKPFRVLVLQFENTEQIEAYRLKCMLNGLSINVPDNLFFSDSQLRVNLSNVSDRLLLENIILQNNAEVVIYDPLTSLHNVNENDNVLIRNVLDNITEINRRTGSSAIVIHHFGKPGDNNMTAHRTRGASSIRDWADTVIAITRKKHEQKILRVLDFIKVRNGPEPRPMLLERSKETFLHQLTEDDITCTPGQVRELLADLGGRITGRDSLIQAIMDKTGCQARRAKFFMAEALRLQNIFAHENPSDRRRKIYAL